MRIPLVLMLALACTGCVSQYKVVVDFSPELRSHFIQYPTIEVDIAAITDSEADEIKQMGVEEYFAPGSGIRQQLQAQTCFFYREERHSYVLPSRAPIWQSWKLKEPTTVLVIASLPHDSSMSAQADPRVLSVQMARSYVFARSIYVWVEPQRIIRVTRAASKSGSSESATTTRQWIETR